MTTSKPSVSVIWSTPDPRRVIAIAARVCYTSMPVEILTEKLEEPEIEKMVKKVLANHHTSTLRHAEFMFSVSGVSRAFSHQLVRHQVGHAYEQRSQHYRIEKDFQFVVPSTIPADMVERYTNAMADDQTLYDDLLAQGVPKEDARQVLPNACETQLVWTANLEAIMNFCKARACRLNCTEITQVSIQVRQHVLKEIPEMREYLGPTCWTQGMCFEGKKYHTDCGKPWKKAVLWSENFPNEIEVIQAGKSPVIVRPDNGD